jgi:hypothetical protein
MSRIDIAITENPHYDPAMSMIENITDKVDGVFSWTIEAFGGFATAHLEMVLSDADAWEMMNRLGKRIIFTHPEAPSASMVCWEGMIQAVTMDDGGASVARSMENCYNQVRVNFTGIDTSVNPPSPYGGGSGYMGTDVLSDAASVALYGKRYLLYQAGTIYGRHFSGLIARGNSMRDVFLSQFAYPRSAATSIKRGGGSSAQTVRVSVDCVGFGYEFAVSFHSETAMADATVSSILSAIISNTNYGYWGIGTPALPPGFPSAWKLDMISTDTTGITANTLTYTRYNFSDKTTRTYIDELMRLGDGATGRRTFWGVYEDRKFTTTVEPVTAEYVARRNDPSEAIFDAATGAEIRPWLVRPGKIIEIPDLLPDGVVYTSALANARTMVIGTVEFTAPSTVILSPVAPDPGGMWGTARGTA